MTAYWLSYFLPCTARFARLRQRQSRFIEALHGCLLRDGDWKEASCAV